MSWSPLSDARPKARKEYRCYLCELPIDVGERHVRRTGVLDGAIETTRMHEACEALTRGWSLDDWECHDAAMFRRHELAKVPAATPGEG